MPAITRLFSDIDLFSAPHPATGDLIAKYDDSAIKNAVKNLILTQHYERPFHSEIGSGVTSLLFDIPSPGLVVLLRQEIINVIQNFEPRVEVLNVDVKFALDLNTVVISIAFQIRNTTRPITVQFTLDRTR